MDDFQEIAMYGVPLKELNVESQSIGWIGFPTGCGPNYGVYLWNEYRNDCERVYMADTAIEMLRYLVDKGWLSSKYLDPSWTGEKNESV